MIAGMVVIVITPGLTIFNSTAVRPQANRGSALRSGPARVGISEAIKSFNRIRFHHGNRFFRSNALEVIYNGYWNVTREYSAGTP
jgi:hypothetical protein